MNHKSIKIDRRLKYALTPAGVEYFAPDLWVGYRVRAQQIIELLNDAQQGMLDEDCWGLEIDRREIALVNADGNVIIVAKRY